MADENTQTQNAPPTATTTNGTAPATAPASTETPWYGNIEDAEIRGYAEMKGWKSPADALKSYRELESLKGVPADRLLKLPDKTTAKPEDWNPVYKALGTPDKPEDYALAVEGDKPEFVAAASQAMLDAHLTKDQATAMAKWFREQGAAMNATDEAEAQRELAAGHAELAQKWPGYDPSPEGKHTGIGLEQIQIASRAASEFGITTEQIDQLEEVMGVSGTLQLLAKIGNSTGQAKFVDGNPDRNHAQNLSGYTPERAAAEKKQMMADPETAKKYFRKDPEVTRRIDQLTMIEAQGRISQRMIR